MTDEVAVKQDQGIYNQEEGWGWTTLVAVPAERRCEPPSDEESSEEIDETVMFITTKSVDAGGRRVR